MSARLLKVLVQPIYVTDDGEHLSEEPGQVLTVPPAQWEDFAAKLLSDISAALDTVNTPQDSPQAK